jgi:hypothetical protein
MERLTFYISVLTVHNGSGGISSSSSSSYIYLDYLK